MYDADPLWRSIVATIDRLLQRLAATKTECDFGGLEADMRSSAAKNCDLTIDPSIAEPWQLSAIGALDEQGINMSLQEQMHLTCTQSAMYSVRLCIGTVCVNDISTYFCAMHSDQGRGIFFVPGIGRQEIDAMDEVCLAIGFGDCAERLFREAAARRGDVAAAASF